MAHEGIGAWPGPRHDGFRRARQAGSGLCTALPVPLPRPLPVPLPAALPTAWAAPRVARVACQCTACLSQLPMPDHGCTTRPLSWPGRCARGAREAHSTAVSMIRFHLKFQSRTSIDGDGQLCRFFRTAAPSVSSVSVLQGQHKKNKKKNNNMANEMYVKTYDSRAPAHVKYFMMNMSFSCMAQASSSLRPSVSRKTPPCCGSAC